MLRIELGEGLSLICTERFPCRKRRGSLGRTEAEAWIGIGGNLGDLPRRFEHFWYVLERERGIRPLESSPILINPPFGYLAQPDFHNAVVRVATSLSPLALLRRLLEIERRFGRKRSFRDAPRTLDLDLLFYDRRKIKHPILRLPHPRWRERESVTIPLCLMKARPSMPTGAEERSLRSLCRSGRYSRYCWSGRRRVVWTK